MLYDDIKKAMPKVDSWCYSEYGKHYTEDVRSEIILIALERKFEDRGVKITSWLIEIAKNICWNVVSYNSYRKANLHDSVTEMICYQECNIDADRINKVVDGLPVFLRTPLKLRMQGFTIREIASIQKLKPSSVKARIWEARNKLKPKLIKVQA